MSFYDEDFKNSENIYYNRENTKPITFIPGLTKSKGDFDFNGFRNSEEFFFLDNRTGEPDKEALKNWF